ncbi:MAG: lysophospholipid acyltransferase family protein [Clostridia bacterium]|nr:lysophospholipid acyltransferase family protein [Clostridia bacterium]
MNWFTYAFIKITGAFAAIPYFKWKIWRSDKKQKKPRLNGNAIIIANHSSIKDLMLIMFLFPLRNIRFLIAEVIYNKGRFMRFVLKCIGGVKVERFSSDFGFIGKSVEILDKGGVLGIFPESKISTDGKIHEFKTSLITIADESEAPIVPIYIDGNYGIFKRVNVVIGESFYINDLTECQSLSKDDLLDLSEKARQKVIELGKCLDNLKKSKSDSKKNKGINEKGKERIFPAEVRR